MKAYLPWNDKYSVEVESIDKQHKKLVELINNLYAGFMEKKSNDHLGEIINGMISYTKEHFATEEKYFKIYKYKKKDEHILEHKQLVKQVLDFKEKFDTGKTSLNYQILSFLKNWLVNHIEGTDKDYIPFFKENNIR